MLDCRSYTHARRHPSVIGRIGGYALPTPLTPAQAVVLVAAGAVVLWTRRWWAVLPGALDLAVGAAVPAVLAWAVRHARVEGRAPWRSAAGALAYLCRPRRGVRTGRPVRAHAAVRVRLDDGRGDR